MSLGYCYSKTVNFTPNCVKRAFFFAQCCLKATIYVECCRFFVKDFFPCILNSTLRLGGGNSKNLNLFSKQGGSVFIVEVTFFLSLVGLPAGANRVNISFFDSSPKKFETQVVEVYNCALKFLI